MSESHERFARPEFNSYGASYPFSYAYNLRAFRTQGRLARVNQSVSPIDQDVRKKIDMISWWSNIFPARLRKREVKREIEYEAVHLTHAMGKLDAEVQGAKDDRKHMRDLLDKAIEKVEARHKK